MVTRPCRPALRLLTAVGALIGLSGSAAAQDCRLALVLALDVSASVDSDEDRLQREGLAGLAWALITAIRSKSLLRPTPGA